MRAVLAALPLTLSLSHGRGDGVATVQANYAAQET